MSLRARSLLALACAALLYGTCARAADDIPPACKTLNIMIEAPQGYQIPFEDMVLPLDRAFHWIDFPDKCGRRGWELLGMTVTACNPGGPPAPSVERGTGPMDGSNLVLVTNRDPDAQQSVQVHSRQYCRIPSSTQFPPKNMTTV